MMDLPKFLGSSAVAPMAAEAPEATAIPPPIPAKPTARAAPRYFIPSPTEAEVTVSVAAGVPSASSAAEPIIGRAKLTARITTRLRKCMARAFLTLTPFLTMITEIRTESTSRATGGQQVDEIHNDYLLNFIGICLAPPARRRMKYRVRIYPDFWRMRGRKARPSPI